MSDSMWMIGMIVIGIVLFVIGYLQGSRREGAGKERRPGTEIPLLEEELARIKGERDELGERTTELTRSTLDLREESSHLKEELTRISEERDDMKKRISKLNASIVEFREHASDHQEELKVLKETEAVREKETEKLQGDVEELRRVFNQQEKTIEDLRKANEMQEQGLEEASKLIKSLLEQLEEMRNRYEQLTLLVVSQNELEEKITELEDRLGIRDEAEDQMEGGEPG